VIGEKINVIIAKLAEANDLKGVIDVADINDPEKLGSGKEMVDRLSNLVAIFNRAELDFCKNRAEGDDILGDAYEYLRCCPGKGANLASAPLCEWETKYLRDVEAIMARRKVREHPYAA
jgi:hypothetical protein